MKLTRRDILKRVGLLAASAIVGGAIALFGALYTIIETTTAKLTNFASEFLDHDDRIAKDIDHTLAAGNRSPFPLCSEGDIGLLRQLLFQSPYLKDVGRLHDGMFLCSAVADKLPEPLAPNAPRMTFPNGRKVYFNAPLEMAKGFQAEVVEQGATNVVVSPMVFSDFNRPPMWYAGAIVNREKKTVQEMYSSGPVDMPLDFLLSDKLMRKNGILYYPQCSKTQPDCVLTSIPMKDIWAPHYSMMAGAATGGALAGLACTSLVLLVNRRRRSLASQLRRSLRKKNLWVLYQPVVDLATGVMVGCEALVRWKDENGTPVRPDVFVQIAEDQGFVGDITRFVLDRVVTEVGDLLKANPGFRVSVNLSAMDLTDATFLPMMEKLLEARGVAPASIGLELTERSTADREHVVKVIRALQQRGHTVYIDDFGTGYSSLAYLNELSVDVVKIDQVFTKTIGTDSVTAAIVPQILGMARALRLKVVVEGVEEQTQADCLMAMGGEIQVQGWLYGRPLTSAALRAKMYGKR